MSTLALPEGTADVVGVMTGQPELFRELQVDVEVVRGARVFLHSGKTTFQHEAQAAKILQAAALGWSQRRIAEVLRVGRDTVRAVVRLAVQAGKMRPVKEVVLEAVGEAAASYAAAVRFAPESRPPAWVVRSGAALFGGGFAAA